VESSGMAFVFYDKTR